MYFINKKSINFLNKILCFIFFSNLLLSAYVVGGRWDLNQQIAYAFRLIDGLSIYSNGQTDLFFPSSPYFPGVGYLSYFLSKLGLDNIYFNEIIMLFVAVFVSFLFFYLIKKLTHKLYPTIDKKIVLFFLTLIFSLFFNEYFLYVREFKPDTILLVCGLLGLFILDIDKKPTKLTHIYIIILLFVSTYFKQSFFLIYILFYLLIFFNKKIRIGEKIFTMSILLLPGMVALFLIFKIENLYYYTIEIMGQHPILDLDSIIYYFGTSFIFNVFFCLSIVFFLIIRIRNLQNISIESIYFLFSIFWFIFSCVASLKVGGNRGNIEVGLIVFSPYVIYSFDFLISKFYNKNIFKITSITLIMVCMVYYSFNFYSNCSEYYQKYNDDRSSIHFLSSKFKGKNAFIDGDTYIIAKASGLNILTESETVGHFNNVPNYDFTKLKNAINDKIYDIIFLKNELSYLSDKQINKSIYENYKFYNDSDLPKNLFKKILIVK